MLSTIEWHHGLKERKAGTCHAGGEPGIQHALTAFSSSVASSGSTAASSKPAARVATPVATRKENPENRVMHALSQRLVVDNALRYKVKMWMFRNACTKPDASSDTSASVATRVRAELGGDSDGHVAYCMMTMVVRNGLQQLMHGRHAFAEHALLVVRHHCVPQHCAAKVVEFAQAWYDWAHMHAPELIQQLRAGSHTLASSCYLAHAERFAQALTHGLHSTPMTGAGSAGKPATGDACTPCMKRPMRGILVLVGFEADAVAKIAELLGAKVTNAAGLAWSPALPAMGTLLALTPCTGTVCIPPSMLRTGIQVACVFWALLVCSEGVRPASPAPSMPGPPVAPVSGPGLLCEWYTFLKVLRTYRPLG